LLAWFWWYALETVQARPELPKGVPPNQNETLLVLPVLLVFNGFAVVWLLALVNVVFSSLNLPNSLRNQCSRRASVVHASTNSSRYIVERAAEKRDVCS
jgi:hypothetical protein